MSVRNHQVQYKQVTSSLYTVMHLQTVCVLLVAVHIILLQWYERIDHPESNEHALCTKYNMESG